MDKAEKALVAKFLQRIQEGKLGEAKSLLENTVNYKIKNKEVKASKEID